MKKLLILLTAFTLFASACNNKGGGDRTKSATTESKDGDKKDSKDDKNNSDEDKTSSSDDKSTSKDGWTAREEDKFLDECIGSATPNVGKARAEEYCDCMLKKMERLYSSYEECDRVLRNATQDDITELAKECNGQ